MMADMNAKKNSHTKCNDKITKGSLAVSVISLMLTAMLFVRIEVMNRKAESEKTTLENRIQRIENDMQAKVQRMVEAILHSTMILNEQSSERNGKISDAEYKVETFSGHRYRKRKNVAQTPGPNAPTIFLQQVRQEIDKKISQVCTSKDKICQIGPPGPPGDPGPHGYPGYKGEKGTPGITGPRGPLGRSGAPGPSGKQGRRGPQGIKGDVGKEGPRGIPGVKGDVGRMGRPGEKGSIGLKGNKGTRGYSGLQGPKGECIIDQKISIYPVSQEVFINTPAIFYCGVDGQTSMKTTWRKLGGVHDVIIGDVLYIENVQKTHVGSYLCSVFTSYGIFRAISTLGIKEPPIFTKKPASQVQAEVGSNLTLCCEARGSISWSRAQRSLNLSPAFQQNGCLTINNVKEESAGKYTCRATNSFGFAESTTGVIVTVGNSREELNKRCGTMTAGKYIITAESKFFEAYCDVQGWTLIARFSNADKKNWMDDQGKWWYDRQRTVGKTTDAFSNADMISPAFWFVSGREFKITRSDDPSHTPLLQTTGNCLAGQTFRSKITSYGNFRNGKVWASNQCLGSCTVQYGGQYKSTHGFERADCSGNIQRANNIGFWCDWSSGDGSVMMIGGGGIGCHSADHGIGITETGAASFVELGGSQTEYDFGYDATRRNTPSKSYSLNLWIR